MFILQELVDPDKIVSIKSDPVQITLILAIPEMRHWTMSVGHKTAQHLQVEGKET
jgi:hypothetical protein